MSGVKGCGLGRPGLLRMYPRIIVILGCVISQEFRVGAVVSLVSVSMFLRLCVTRSHQQRLSAHFYGIARVGAHDQIRKSRNTG